MTATRAMVRGDHPSRITVPITVGTHRSAQETDYDDYETYAVKGCFGYPHHASLASARSHVAREIVRMRRELRAHGMNPVFTVSHTSHRTAYPAGW